MSRQTHIAIPGAGPGEYVATIRAPKPGVTIFQVDEIIHAHLAMAEGVMEAAEDAEGQAIHQGRKRVE